ncbi:T9SS type A sorting domain-containing protein [Flavobacterium soli]|uniref:T9SS type A sorting domain-containing protein n=1 Tax=Flavobacterium soli TaxID=344881 RepID=UPI0004052187|nr:T9SS type A sorting domain-containing protein [Flavobacterium soli]
MKFKITIFCILISFLEMHAQVTNEGKPVSWSLEYKQKLAPIVLPEIDLKTLQAEDAINDQRKDLPWRFGQEIIVDYNLGNSGQWTTLDNGDRIWRIRFQSKGAKTMNFIFSDFYMPEGATLYLYNSTHTDLLGAYDAKQNNDQRVLGTWLVNGADIWLEYFEPKAQLDKGKLEIFKVVHGYRTSDENLKAVDDDLNSAGKCNYDVDCVMGSIDSMKNINKKSVGLMITNNNSFCTGALINNTSNDGTPYFLTANHCYSNPATWSFRFKWISPNPVCAQNLQSTNTTGYLTISGATLKAKRYESDFCLVQINNAIPSTWDVKWAGWDRSTTAPPSVFGIHHPAGAIMKVCLDNGAPSSFNDNGNYWQVNDWTQGVTEGGSSGSPLFNHQGRIIGQLWRGSAACSGIVDNGGSDDYGRFNTSWNTGTTAASRLKDWLDPTNTNLMTTDVYPPDVVYAVNAKASIVGITAPLCSAQITPSIKITNNGSSVLTSATLKYNLNTNPQTTINWTGNLLQGQSADVAVGTLTVANGENTFNATVESPNGTVDGFPSDNTTLFNFSTVTTYETTQVVFQLNTDDYGDETSWDVKDANDVVVASGGNYPNETTINQTIDLPADGCYTFTINDDAADGICCDYGFGSYSLKTTDNVIIIQGGDFGSGESITFGASENLSTDDFASANFLKVYPNPSNGIFNLKFDTTVDFQFEVYNLLGQTIKKGSSNSNQHQIDLSGNAEGVYLLKVTDVVSNKTKNFKLIKE